MFLHQACNCIEKFCPSGTTNSFPSACAALALCMARSTSSALCLANLSKEFTRRWIAGLEGFPTFRNIRFSIDKESKFCSFFFNPFKSRLWVFRELSRNPLFLKYLYFHSLSHGVSVIGRVVARHKMFKLSFDIPQQTGSSKSKKIRLKPSVTQFLLHQCRYVRASFALEIPPAGCIQHGIRCGQNNPESDGSL